MEMSKSDKRQKELYEREMAQMERWDETRFMRTLDWIEERTTGTGTWPWGDIWMWRSFSFGFASGDSGFWIALPLPRMLPGFVRRYQVQELRTREGRRNSDLTLFIPLLPLGRWHTSRTMRLRERGKRAR